MRGLPFFKAKNTPQFAGFNFSDDSSGGGGGYTLPVASSSCLGGVKIGSGVNVASDGTISVSGGGGGLPDYSTTEQSIGQKWADGKDLYFKTYVGSGTGKNITIDANFSNSTYNIKFVQGGYDYLGETWAPINGRYSDWGTNTIGRNDQGALILQLQSSVSVSYSITIFYTKNS